IWNLTDALALRQPAQAMRALRDLRRNDQNPIYILSMIARQYRMLIEVKSLLAAGVGDPYDIAKQLGYAAYPVQKALQWSHQYSFAELEAILERLLEVDMAMKTGADQDTELDVLTAELCLQRRARQRGIAIDGGAVALLCNFVGPNLRQLDNELEKLSLYAGGRPITQQDVRTMVADASEEMIW
ncbi:MAG: hypothetical protein CUN48_16235, partial [Candidatus Thermofonsia Clade 3 bacterium]